MANQLTRPQPKKKLEFKFQFKLKDILLWGIVGFLFLWIVAGIFFISPFNSQVPLSQALSDIKAGKVEKVEVSSNRLFLYYKGQTEPQVSEKETQDSFPQLLKDSGIETTQVDFEVKSSRFSDLFISFLSNILPVILMVVFFFFIFRQARGAQDSIFSFGKSRAQLFQKNGKAKVNFGDVAGVDDAKKELEEIVDFLKHPGKYRRVGARTPKGVLLVGPAGVGKTLLARAVAGEANVPFFSMAGSEFMEMLVGVGASRVRDLFLTAKKAAPSLIFIDEIDAIGRQRAAGGFVGGHDEREQTLNQILVEMDGFTPNDNVLILAATNRGDLLDPALLRPGRFDRRVMLDMPDKEGRTEILKIHARGKPFTKDVNWEKISSRTVGFSGADIENMLNEAAIQAARSDRLQITMADIEEAATKVKLGPVKRKLQSEEDRKMTAYHEAGHAIVTTFLPHTDPVHRISIVARGMSLGHTLIPPEMDRAHETQTRLTEQIAAMLGGRAAEDAVFSEFTTGAANDIDQATHIARRMVIDFGMSPLGPVNLGPQTDYSEFGRPVFYDPQTVSPQMQAKIDSQVSQIIDAAYKKSVKIIKSKRQLLDKVVAALLQKETIDREEFEAIIGKKTRSE